MTKTNQNQDDPILKIVVRIADHVQYETKKNGEVTIITANHAKIQKFMRRIKFLKIPEYSKVDLDKFSSFVWLQIDGQKTIYEIGQQVEKQFGKDEYLYERLLLFLNQIEHDRQWIKRVA